MLTVATPFSFERMRKDYKGSSFDSTEISKTEFFNAINAAYAGTGKQPSVQAGPNRSNKRGSITISSPIDGQKPASCSISEAGMAVLREKGIVQPVLKTLADGSSLVECYTTTLNSMQFLVNVAELLTLREIPVKNKEGEGTHLSHNWGKKSEFQAREASVVSLENLKSAFGF